MANKGKRGAARRSAKPDVEQAKQKLETTADSLVQRYAFEGIIDQQTQGFTYEYESAVYDIVQPFYTARDADALAELAIARLEQIQRISVSNELTFYGFEMVQIRTQLERAHDLSNDEQRARLLALLVNFLTERLGNSHEWLIDSERNLVENFISDVFAWDPHFAHVVIEVADMRLDALQAIPEDASVNAMLAGDPNFGYDTQREYEAVEHAQMLWSITRMTAMATRGDTAEELYAYAEASDLLEFTEAICLIANAYEAAGNPRKAIALLRENMDATDMFYTYDGAFESPQLVDYLIEMAWRHYSKVELVNLYCELLLNDSNTAMFSWYNRDDRLDIMRWYDELRGMMRTPEWDSMRDKLLSLVSDKRRKVLLNHEKNVRAFHRQMVQALDEGFSVADQYEENCSGTGPLFPATYYISYAELLMERANTRRDYRNVATALAYAASLCGEFDLAQKSADEIAVRHSRKKALHEELRSVGFDV